jgi:hypothetical protein
MNRGMTAKVYLLLESGKRKEKVGGNKMKKLIKNVITWAPVIYPIAKKIMNKRKANKIKTSTY